MTDRLVRITVELPALLGPVVGGASTVELDAATLRGALDTLVERHPALRVHLFDETGDLRRHVLCLHNDANSRWREDGDASLAEGDRLTLLQAVSGG